MYCKVSYKTSVARDFSEDIGAEGKDYILMHLKYVLWIRTENTWFGVRVVQWRDFVKTVTLNFSFYYTKIGLNNYRGF
jgi:hypothetical protein